MHERAVGLLLGVVACSVGLAGCATPQPAPAGPVTPAHASATTTGPRSDDGPGAPGRPPAAPPTHPWTIVALGDSVPRGTSCGCTPYPALTARGLERSAAVPVHVANDSAAGFTTADVLRQIRSDGSVEEAIRSADVVEIEIGANDLGYSTWCATETACYTDQVPQVRRNLSTIVDLIHGLTVGRHPLVVLLDYWNVWLGGRAASAQGDDYVAASRTVTGELSDTIRSVAAETGSQFVDLRRAFGVRGPAGDESTLLAADGDHPNAAGHQRIAEAVLAVAEPALGL